MRALLALSGGCRRRFRASGALRALYSKFVWRGRKGQNARLEHFSAACPVSLLRVRYSGSLRGRLHRCTMDTCSARIDPSSLRGRLHRCTMETCSARIELHTIFALAPWATSLKNALKHGYVLLSVSLQSGRRRCSPHIIDDLAFAARRICPANGSRSSLPPVAARAGHAPDRRLGADTRGGCRRVHLGASALASRMDDAWTGIDLFFGWLARALRARAFHRARVSRKRLATAVSAVRSMGMDHDGLFSDLGHQCL